MQQSLFLQARHVIPVAQAAVPGGIVEISGNRIAGIHPAAQKARLPKDHFFDLGNSLIIPGLINAHCHLDYTSMAGVIPPPSGFTTWIHAIQGLKREWSIEDFKASWIKGARMLLESGVTTVCDVESVWDLVPQITRSTPLRVISCLEIISFRDPAETPFLWDKLTELKEAASSDEWAMGLSPHAPYSTTPSLLAVLSKMFDIKTTITMHIGESAEEWEMFKHQKGAMHDWLASQRSMKTCAGKSPVQIVQDSGLLSPAFLGVHMNHVDEDDAQAFGEAGASAVHCPRSHSYFGHEEFPFDLLKKKGVRICLGTDSLATVRVSKTSTTKLSLFAEMHEFMRKNPNVPPAEVLKMTTQNAAEALGLGGLAGVLDKGAFADLLVIPLKEQTSNPCETALSNDCVNPAVMIGGTWVIPPSQLQS